MFSTSIPFRLKFFFLVLLRYKMFEDHMDDYLDEEIETTRRAFDVICRDWDNKVCHYYSSPSTFHALLHVADVFPAHGDRAANDKWHGFHAFPRVA